MSKSAKSVFVFGLYLELLGMTLLVVPNVLPAGSCPALPKYGFESLAC